MLLFMSPTLELLTWNPNDGLIFLTQFNYILQHLARRTSCSKTKLNDVVRLDMNYGVRNRAQRWE